MPSRQQSRSPNAVLGLPGAAGALQALIDLVPAGILVADSGGRLVLANGVTIDLFGAEVTGHAFGQAPGYTLHHPDGSPFPPDELPLARALRQQERLENVALLVRRRVGESALLLVSAGPVLDDQGRLQGAIAIFQDITARRRIEQERMRLAAEAEAERARLQAVLEQLPAGVLIAEAPSGRVTMGNEQMARIWGRPVELGRPVAEFRDWQGFHPDGRPYQAGEWPLDRSLRDGEVVWGEEVDIVRADGSRATALLNSAPIRDAQGRVTGGVVVDLDITDRKAAQEELQRRLAELDATVSAVADGLVIYGTDGRILRINEVAARLLGYGPELLGQPLAERLAAWHGAMRREDGTALPVEDLPVASALRGEVARNVVMAVERDGVTTWLSTSAAPIRRPDGTLLGAVATFTDITRLRELQQQQELYIHTVSHDLRNPLAIIGGHAELLRRTVMQAPECQAGLANLEAIERGVQRLEAMIQDLVDSARLAARQLTLDLQPVDLRRYLADLLQRASAAMDTARVHAELPAGLPPVLADYGRLERIVLNLLSNALKYSPESSPVTVTATARPPFVELAVADRGPGIPPEDLPHLFEPYFRAPRARGRESIGLGLYITCMLVVAHGGRLWVDSRPGEGSTFHFTLPIAA